MQSGEAETKLSTAAGVIQKVIKTEQVALKCTEKLSAAARQGCFKFPTNLQKLLSFFPKRLLFVLRPELIASFRAISPLYKSLELYIIVKYTILIK